MIGFQGEKEFYIKIQKSLFEMIPESWKCILLHTSIIDIRGQKPKGEVYLYYIPKGILKRKPVNCYEIPGLFDIDEEDYSRLITNLYNEIKKMRDSYKVTKNKVWTTIEISCTKRKFKVKYGFEDIRKSEYTSEERHIIWRYENLNIDRESFSKEEKKIIDYYLQVKQNSFAPMIEVHEEDIYDQPIVASVDYERTLTLDEVIAREKEEQRIEEKKKKKIAKKRKKKQLDILDGESDEITIIKNQILKKF